MLGESFIHIYNYSGENICSSDNQESLNPPADQVYGSCALNLMEDVTASLNSTKSVWAESREPKPDLFDPNPTPFSLNNKPHTSCSDLRLRSITESKQIHTTDPPQHCSSVLDHSGPLHLRVFVPDKQVLVPDDGYLVMDGSIVQNGEPPTNSMLNVYLDRKLQEVYSQYLQERLACPGSSLDSSLLPPFHPPNLLPISHLFNVDSSLQSEERQSQGGVSQSASSHFSSPVLRISNAVEATQPRNARNQDTN